MFGSIHTINKGGKNAKLKINQRRVPSLCTFKPSDKKSHRPKETPKNEVATLKEVNTSAKVVTQAFDNARDNASTNALVVWPDVKIRDKLFSPVCGNTPCMAHTHNT